MSSLPGRYLIIPRQRAMITRQTRPQRPQNLYPKVDASHPAIASLDPAFLEYQRAVRRRGMEEIPVSESQNGLWDARACATSFAQASYISGWSMNPVTCPLIDNTVIREEMGLADHFLDPRHRELFHLLARLFFSPEHWREYTSVHLNKLSSTGAPLATPNDVALKLWILREASTHWADICNLIHAGKYDEAADKFGASLLSILGFRCQSSDKVDVQTDVNGELRVVAKERLVNDIPFGLSAGRSGHRLPADRHVIWNGVLIPDMCAQRTRTVWAAPAWLTYLFTAWMAQARHHYFNLAEYTLEHRGAADIRRKLSGSTGVRGLDISQYDQSIAAWMIDAFCDEVTCYMGPLSGELFRWQFHLPFWMPNPDVNATGGFVVGNPANPAALDGGFSINPGLPSGIAPNPDVGKFMMLWTLLTITADELGGIYDPMAQRGSAGDEELVTRNIIRWLRGEHDTVRVLNCGDDTILSTTGSDDDLELITQAFNKPRGYYFKMEIESAPKFLGNVICQGAQGIEVYPDLFSCYANWDMAERAVDSRARRDHWAEGYVSRDVYYQAAPEWESFARIRHDESKRVFGAPLTEWAAIAGGAAGGITTAESMLLEHPERLMYLPIPEDVNQDLIDSFVCGVDAAEAEQLIKPIFTT